MPRKKKDQPTKENNPPPKEAKTKKQTKKTIKEEKKVEFQKIPTIQDRDPKLKYISFSSLNKDHYLTLLP